MIADFAEYRANYEFSSGGLASAQRLDVKLRAAGRRPASSGAPLAAHPLMPVQVARRRANSRRSSRLGRREKRGRTVHFNGELGRCEFLPPLDAPLQCDSVANRCVLNSQHTTWLGVMI